jgi:hypothetical protein
MTVSRSTVELVRGELQSGLYIAELRRGGQRYRGKILFE